MVRNLNFLIYCSNINCLIFFLLVVFRLVLDCFLKGLFFWWKNLPGFFFIFRFEAYSGLQTILGCFQPILTDFRADLKISADLLWRFFNHLGIKKRLIFLVLSFSALFVLYCSFLFFVVSFFLVVFRSFVFFFVIFLYFYVLFFIVLYFS